MALKIIFAPAATSPTPSLPSWVPAAGSVVAIGYSSGTHPTQPYATVQDLTPIGKSWNPTPLTLGPWGGNTPYQIYTWNSIFSYCGAIFNETQRKFMGFGGGHSSVCVPVPFAFNLDNLSWDWLATPIPSDNLEKLNKADLSVAATQAIYPIAQLDANFNEWQGNWSGWPSGFEQPGKIFPEPGHSCFSLVWVPGSAHGNTNGVLLPTGNPTGSATGTSAAARHYFDLDTNVWVRTATSRTNANASAGGSIWFAGSVNKVFAFTNVSSTSKSTMDVYTPSTKTWSQTTATSAISLPIFSGGLGAHLPSGLLLQFCPETLAGVATYAGVRHRIYAVSAAAAAAGSHTWSVLTVTASSWPLNASGDISTIGWTYCSRNGCFYAINSLNNSTTLWKLSPPSGAVTQADYLSGTWTVTTETLSTPISNRSGTGLSNAGTVYNKMTWDDTSRCLIYIEEYPDAKVQAIRPSGIV